MYGKVIIQELGIKVRRSFLATTTLAAIQKGQPSPIMRVKDGRLVGDRDGRHSTDGRDQGCGGTNCTSNALAVAVTMERKQRTLTILEHNTL